jgi:cell division protein FtsA
LQHHAVVQALPVAIEAPATRIGRIGSWIRENF